MILAILQARYSSSRLPGKVLKTILTKPMLALQIERILRAKKIDKLIVATSIDTSDDPIVKLCKKLNIECFRGNLDNVLDRFYQAAALYKPEYVVRLTGDCPLTDPKIIDAVIQFCLDGKYDYASNALEPTFPDGLDIEIFKFSCLEDAWKKAKLPSQQEHVTPFIYSQPEFYKIGAFKNETDYSHLRWTVDEKEDLEFVGKVYEALYKHKPTFTMQDVLSFLQHHPELTIMNAGYQRNEGLKKSLQKDKEYHE